MQSGAVNRRAALGLMSTGLALGAGISPAFAALNALTTVQFDDPVIEKFYSAREFATLWTGQGGRCAAKGCVASL